MRAAPLLSLAIALAPFVSPRLVAAQQVVEVGPAFPQLVSPGEAADQFRMAAGRVVVTILYRTGCPRGRRGWFRASSSSRNRTPRTTSRFVAVAMRTPPEEVPEPLAYMLASVTAGRNDPRPSRRSPGSSPPT